MNNTIFKKPELLDSKSFNNYLNKLSNENTYIYLSGEELNNQDTDNILNSYINNKNGNIFTLFAINDNQVIGLVTLSFALYERKRGLNRVYLYLTVDSNYRGSGIGSKLLDKAIEFAKTQPIKLILLNVFDENKKAIKLYEKNGFLTYGLLKDGLIYNNKPCDERLMFLNIEERTRQLE